MHRLMLLFVSLMLATAQAAASPAMPYPQGLFPPGFLVFCAENPRECAPPPPSAPLKMSAWRGILDRVNREVNASIIYAPDAGHVGGNRTELYERVGRGDVPDGDRWTVSPQFGDCDDYVVTKRQKLLEAGAPSGAMRFAYVLPIGMGPHVFLVVSTDGGDMVLDNNSDEIDRLDAYMLERLSIQDATNPRQWWQVY